MVRCRALRHTQVPHSLAPPGSAEGHCESSGRKRTIAQAVAKDGGERVLRTVGGPSCVAKNRYRITDDLPLAWPAFVNALSHHQPTQE